MSDGRITSFVDPNGIKADKKIIVDALNEVLATIDTINTTKMQIFGAASLKDVSKSINELSGSYEKLAKTQQKVFDAQIKEEKLKTQQAETALRNAKAVVEEYRAKELEAKAREKNAAAIEKEERALRNKNSASGQSGASPVRIFSAKDINTLKTDIAFLENKIAALRQKMKNLGASDVGRNSPEFLQAAKAVNHYTGQLTHAEKQLAKLSEQEQIRQSIRRQDGKAEAAFDKEIANTRKLNSDWNSLLVTLNQLQQELQELGAKDYLGKTTLAEKQRIGDLQIQTAELARAIGKIDALSARSGANAASYARQFFSFQQILRETPSLQFGIATYMAALSNNIPIFLDDVKRVQEENKRLANSGKPVESVGRAIFKSIFNWQTAILGLITAIVLLGPVLAKWLADKFRTETQLRRNYLATKEYAAVQEKLASATRDLVDAFKSLSEIQSRESDRAIKKLRSELEVMRSLGLSADKYFGLREKIAALETTAAADNLQRTADALAKQANIIDKSFLTDARSNLKLLEQDYKKTVQTLKVSQGPTPIIVGGATSQSSVAPFSKAKTTLAEKALEQKVANSIAEEIRLQKKRIALDESSVAATKKYTDEKTAIEKAYIDGVITLEEKKNRELLSLHTYLRTQMQITDDKALLATETRVLRTAQLENNLDRVNLERGDPTKDKAVIAAERHLAAAKKQEEAANALGGQVVAAFEQVDAAAEEAAKLRNEKIKFHSDEARRIRLAEAEEEVSITTTKNQLILNNERSTLRQRLNALEEIKNASIRGAAAQLEDVQDDMGATPAAKIAAMHQYNAQVFAITKQNEEAVRELKDRFLERNRTAQKEARDSERDYAIKTDEQITASNLSNLQDRLDAEQRAFDQRKQKLVDEYNLKLRNAGMSDAQIEEMDKDRTKILEGFKLTNDELRSLQIKLGNDIVALTDDTSKNVIEIWKKELEKQEELHATFLAEIDRLYSALSTAQVNSYSEDLNELNNQLLNKLISYKEYLAEKEKLDKGARDKERSTRVAEIKSKLERPEIKNAPTNVKTNQQAVDGLEKALAVPGITPQERANLQQRLVLAKELLNTSIKHLNEKIGFEKELAELNKASAVDFAAAAEEEAARLQEAYRNAFDAMKQLGDALLQGGFERRQSQLEKELELLEKKSEREKAIIEQTVANEEEKNKRLKLLEDRRQAQVDIIERKKRQLEIRRAQAEKMQSVLEIGINLYKALAAIKLNANILLSNPLTAGLAPMAFAQIPLAIAAAAMQTAAVIATPIPKYKHGTLDHVGGAAIVGDGGKSELVVTPDGELIRTPSVPTLMQLPTHSVVYPDAEAFTRNAVKAKTDLTLSMAGQNDELREALNKGFASLNKTIRNKPEIILKKGMTTDLLMRYGKDYWKYL